MKIRAIQGQPTRVIRDSPDLQHLLALPGIDHNETRGYFERAGLLELYERLRPPPAEPLDLDGLPRPSPAVAEAMERARPGPVSLEEYARFLKQFRWTEEQLRAAPAPAGPMFTLD